jgi:23S rRNA (cytidine1920-2'-O)/16S rRNA (cytidine1409-2'-O)-methyltransferase
MARRVRLLDALANRHPNISDPDRFIRSGSVFVDGRPVLNPASMVEPEASIVIHELGELRGSVKLRAALDMFDVPVEGRVALDVGAAAGGFTTVLVERGAVKVYAVDAGHGQLRGLIRQDPRVVDLEATNIAALTTDLVPEAVDVVTVDVSYLSLAQAVRQLHRIRLAPGADLVGLVKPMFELRRPTAPTDRRSLDEALDRAVDGVVAGGWTVLATMDSPVTGAKGAPELFVHGRFQEGTQARQAIDGILFTLVA